MNKILAIGIILAFLGGLLGLSLIGLNMFNHDPMVYTGKVMFESETEYNEFKSAVGSEDVKIKEMEVLSSEPPIIVQFSITSPVDKIFPYGKPVTGMQRFSDTQAVPMVLIGAFYIAIFGTMTAFSVTYLWRKRRG